MQNVNMNIHDVKSITVTSPTVKECSWADSGEHRWHHIVIKCESGDDIKITVHSNNPIDVNNMGSYTFATEVVENG
jgi:hypothetical protein